MEEHQQVDTLETATKKKKKKKKKKNNKDKTEGRLTQAQQILHETQVDTEQKKAAAKLLSKKTKKYARGEAPRRKELSAIKSLKLKRRLKAQEKAAEAAAEATARAELLLPEEAGYLESDPKSATQTWQLPQRKLKPHLDRRSAKKVFELDLPVYGPYKLDYTRNGRWLLMGGRRGHIVLMDWMDMKLSSELQLRETVRDITFLHDQTMFAVAQKKYTYIYDNQGIELHVLRNHVDINVLDFLPYHYLLCTVGKTGYLKYQDTSTGQLVAEHRTKLGDCRVMKQNPSNAVQHLGHSNGTVTLWSPNMNTPLVKMLAHRAPVQSMAIDRAGNHMVTAGLDGQIKVWDVRTYKQIHAYFSIRPATTLDISQRGMLAVGNGPHVQVLHACVSTPQLNPLYIYNLFFR